jgi:N-acyl-L-homoserine lactone synthetase
LNGQAEGLDIDRYDARARHYGWYLNGELVGCVRFVEPDESEDALPMLRYMS